MTEIPVLALIPAWNEAARVGPVVEATRAHLPVLVVDDGSHDETSAVAEAAGATVVRHPQNQGKGAALMTGFTWALEHGYEAVITLDADGQHDPDEISKFLAAYEAGAGDLIIGRRDFDQMPFPRNYTNRIFGSRLLSWALGVHIHDSQSGYRLYGRRLLEKLNLATTGFELEVEVIIQAVCWRPQQSRGMRIGWVEIRTIYGVGEVSYFHPLKDSARFLAMVWRAWRRRRLTLDVSRAQQV
ncbi:MAG TPA: glycosyltransferase family 2 protein [Thermoflexia bacterium]|nr:glycosyltransferase family 2 protein [Thermoflexia bacterium]